jgi:hypothetical protein
MRSSSWNIYFLTFLEHEWSTSQSHVKYHIKTQSTWTQLIALHLLGCRDWEQHNLIFPTKCLTSPPFYLKIEISSFWNVYLFIFLRFWNMRQWPSPNAKQDRNVEINMTNAELFLFTILSSTNINNVWIFTTKIPIHSD